MRPLRLMMQAFGPYADRQQLDFEALASAPLFLVHGRTGAGKSSILDAICFALYGEASGSERPATQLRSRQAKPDVLTEVRLDFRLGDAHYRIHRQPAQKHPLKRGKGFTKEDKGPFAWLYRRAPDMPEREEGTLLAEGVKEVNEAVQRLLGLTVQQFRQVIVLPQGEFRRLLSADSGEREEILQRLFETALYEHITEEMRQRAAALQQELQQALQQRQAILDAHGMQDEAALQAALDDAEKSIEELSATVQEIERKEERESAALQQAEAIVERLRKHRQAQQALRELQAQQPRFTALEQALQRAEQAQAVQPHADALQQAEQRHEQASASVQQAEQALQEAETALRQAEERQQQVAEQASGLPMLHERLARLRDRLPDIRHLAALQDQRVRLQRQRQQLQQARQQQETELRRLRSEQEKARQALSTCEEQARQHETLALRLEQLRERMRQTRRLRQLDAEWKQLTQQEDAAQRQVEEAEAALQQAEAELRRLQQARDAAHALALSHQLHPGAPCPVCGSVEHPAPAHATIADDAQAPTPEQLQQAEEVLGKARQRLRQQQDALHELRLRMATAEGERQQLQQQLTGGHMPEEAALRASEKQLQEQLQQADAARRVLPDLQRKLQELDEASAQVEQALQQAQQELSALQSTLRATEQEQQRLHAGLPEEWRDPQQAEHLLQDMRQRIERLEKAQEQAETRLQEARRKAEAARTALRERRATLQQEEQCLRQARDAFAMLLREHDFADAEEWQAAMLPDEERQRQRQELQDFRHRLTEAAALARQAAAEAEGLTQPDITPLREALRQTRAQLQQARERLAALRARRDALRQAAENLRQQARQQAELQRRHDGVHALAACMRGENAARMSLHRYVLAALLDEVLLAASERLRLMSAGRYTLQRRRQVADRRRIAGLDLDVLDEWNGELRPVQTLSGGEGFLAALALALGLADVVQARSGGLRMEALFIDEGFGALDAEALDRALDALLRLRGGAENGGQRIIGIISHLAELRERIPAQLEVIASRGGSHLRLHLP